jgi:hypothetical protein
LGEPRSDNILPVQDEIGLAEALARQSRSQRAADEIGERHAVSAICWTRRSHGRGYWQLRKAGWPVATFSRHYRILRGSFRAEQRGGAPLQCSLRDIFDTDGIPPAVKQGIFKFSAAIAREPVSMGRRAMRLAATARPAKESTPST